MAENAVLRELAADGLLEGIDVIDAFADERALVEQVLVYVRDRASIGVNPGLTENKRAKPERRELAMVIATRGCRTA